MMNYEIGYIDEKKKIPVVVFEDDKYKLVAEFFLAEGRNFGRELLVALVRAQHGKTAHFAGNAFSLDIAVDFTVVTNDFTDAQCRISTDILRKVAADYLAACE